MTDAIIIIILTVLVFLAVFYIIRAKKKGQACIGCPNASGCSRKCHCNTNKNINTNANANAGTDNR